MQMMVERLQRFGQGSQCRVDMLPPKGLYVDFLLSSIRRCFWRNIALSMNRNLDFVAWINSHFAFTCDMCAPI